MLTNKLKEFGLEEKESKVYLAILELGRANIEQISKKSKVKRTTVYEMIDLLKTKGLISTTTKGKRKIFIAEDPRTIEDNLKEKLVSFERVLPEILSIANFLEKKPSIRYFEGLDGVKEIYKDALSYHNQEILSWWARDYADEVINDDFFQNYHAKKRLENKIWMRAIAPSSKTRERLLLKYSKENALRTIKIVPGEELPSSVEITIYGKKKVAIISIKEKMGIIIESVMIYETLKHIFEMAWRSIPEQK